jgi:hypothetical protein
VNPTYSNQSEVEGEEHLHAGIVFFLAAEDAFDGLQEVAVGEGALEGGIRDEPGHALEFRLGEEGGGEDDGDGAVGGADFLDEFEAGQAGEIVIGDDEVEVAGLEGFPGGEAVGGEFGFVAGFDEDLEMGVGGLRVGVNEEEATRGIWAGGFQIEREAGIDDVDFGFQNVINIVPVCGPI